MLTLETLSPRDITTFVGPFFKEDASHGSLDPAIVLLTFVLPVVRGAIALSGRQIVHWKFTSRDHALDCATPQSIFQQYDQKRVQKKSLFYEVNASNIPSNKIKDFLRKIVSTHEACLLSLLQIGPSTYFHTNYDFPIRGAALIIRNLLLKGSFIMPNVGPISCEEEVLPEMEDLVLEEPIPLQVNYTGGTPSVLESRQNPFVSVPYRVTTDLREHELDVLGPPIKKDLKEKTREPLTKSGDEVTSTKSGDEVTSKRPVSEVVPTRPAEKEISLRTIQFGCFAPLPNEIIRNIFEIYVPNQKVEIPVPESDGTRFRIVITHPYPLLSKGFRDLCGSVLFVKRFFPKELIETIGINLLRKVPPLDLKSRVIAAPQRLDDEEWKKQLAMGVYQSDQIKDPLGDPLQGVCKEDRRALYYQDPSDMSKPSIKLIDPPLEGIPCLARKNLEGGCQINFFVHPEEFGKNRFFFYCDSAGRPGFLATYELSYPIDHYLTSTFGVCGFHQVDPSRPDVWVWHDFTIPSITSKVNEKMLEIEWPPSSLPHNLRWFYFIRYEKGKLTQDSKGNIQWFSQFFRGKKVLWLMPGGESKHFNAPTLKAEIYTRPPTTYEKLSSLTSSNVSRFIGAWDWSKDTVSTFCNFVQNVNNQIDLKDDSSTQDQKPQKGE